MAKCESRICGQGRETGIVKRETTGYVTTDHRTVALEICDCRFVKGDVVAYVNLLILS